MKFKFISIPCLVVFLSMVLQPTAYSWGPEAHKSMALSAYQILQYDIFEIAKAGEVSYEGDLLRGAMDGRRIIEESLPIDNDEQAIAAIDYEVQLLRAVRQQGVGSHFAYRLGVLSALVSDVMHPFGIAYTDGDAKLKEQIDVDIDETVYQQNITILHTKNNYIASMGRYIAKTRPFYSDDQVLIRDEYRRGINFRGYAGTTTSHYYERSVEAIVDVWYTIMHPKENPRAAKPSERAITWYFVNEIKYLLEVRKNIDYADRAYGVYESVSPGIIETHLAIGDLYYGFDTRDSHSKGVEQWVMVQQVPGAFRQDASARLSGHYISEGDAYLAHSKTPEAMESDLSEALHSFTLALQYDRTNVEAAEKISATSVAIQERKEEYTLQQKYIDGAMLAIQEAEKSLLDKDFGTTLFAYNQALTMLALVDDAFRDLQETSKETISRVKKDKKTAVREVINTANTSLEAGDTAQLNGNWDEAVLSYNAAKALVTVVPDPSLLDAQTIQAIIESADLGISDTEISKNRANKNKNTRPGGTQL